MAKLKCLYNEYFQAPVKAEPWTETIDAFEYGNRCVQYSDTHVVGDEDCLYLNVFVPAQCLANNNETLAVIFAVTGGAFQYEFAWNYGPDFFIDQNVIVVSISLLEEKERMK